MTKACESGPMKSVLVQRRMSNPAFHHTRIVEYGTTMAAYADRMSGWWQDGQQVNMHEEMVRLTFAVVGSPAYFARHPRPVVPGDLAAHRGIRARMTNGSVSGSKMTNGAASKMSNGSVSSTNGSTLVVQFAGGTTTAVVPPHTTVTEIKATNEKLAVGDRVTVIATRGAGGTLTSRKVMLSSSS